MESASEAPPFAGTALNEKSPETRPFSLEGRIRPDNEDATFWTATRSEFTVLRLVVVVLLIHHRESRQVQFWIEPAHTQTENRAEHKTHESEINSRRHERVCRPQKEKAAHWRGLLTINK
jgi:hypothetical protein